MFLIALLVVCLGVSTVSAQVGNSKLHLLVEYFLPYWRQHRARLRPYAFAQPVPVWRVARSADNVQLDEQEPVRDDYIGCLYMDAQLLCEKISNDRRTDESVVCDVRKNIVNPVLNNFVSFSMSSKRGNDVFNLLPKKPSGVNVELSELRGTRQLSLHWKDSQDEGFEFQDKKCWDRLSNLLTSVQPTTIKVKKVNSKNELMQSGTEEIIGNLIVIDFGL